MSLIGPIYEDLGALHMRKDGQSTKKATNGKGAAARCSVSQAGFQILGKMSPTGHAHRWLPFSTQQNTRTFLFKTLQDKLFR